MKKTLLLILITLISCSDPVPNSKIEIYDSSIESIIDIYSQIEIIADSIALPEGPVWDSKSNSLLFVDIMNNKVHKWNSADGVSDFISPSGNTGYAPNLDFGMLGANGLAIDSNGKLFLCQHGDRRIAKTSINPSTKPEFLTVIDNYEGKKFNSPNDLVFGNDGSIYFTDPAFGFFNFETFEFVEDDIKKLNFNGVYRYNPDNNNLSLITDKIDLPNGIGISPDNKFLYVNKMSVLDGNPKIIKIDIDNYNQTELFDGKELMEMYKGYFDGMTVHSSGNIFTSGPGGLLVVSNEGKLMAKIDLGHLTNVTFDDDEGYVYATGFVDNPKVFRIKVKN